MIEGLKAPTGRIYDSLGQRPGNTHRKTHQVLKGRPKPCRNPSPASISISSSAPRIASRSSPTGFAILSTHTWPPCCRMSDVSRCSSTPSKTTFICFSTLAGPSLSASPWRPSRNHPRNGSRPKVRNSPLSLGRAAMAHLLFRNRMSPPFGNTLPRSGSITGRNHFKTSSGHFSNDTGYRLTNGMSGIDAAAWTALSGLDFRSVPNPGRCPGLAWNRPFGALEGGEA